MTDQPTSHSQLKKRLIDAIKIKKSPALNNPKLKLSCVFKNSGTGPAKCLNCDNKGYNLYKNGAYVSARLCQCVKNCPSCHGSFLHLSTKNNKSVPCIDLSPQIIVTNYNFSSVPVKYIDAELTKFRNYSGNGDLILTQLKKYIDSFRKLNIADKAPDQLINFDESFYNNNQKHHNNINNYGIIISGAIGVGKTYLLASLAKEFINKGYTVKMIDFFQLISQIKAGFNENISEDKLIKPLIDVDILLIDELGKGRNSTFELTILDQIVMGRYNQNKFILATTNYALYNDQTPKKSVDLHDLTAASNNFDDHHGLLKDRMGGRIFSRLKESCHFLNLTGSDYRQMKSQGRIKL